MIRMIKRIFSLTVAALMIATLFFLNYPSQHRVHATESNGYWRLVRVDFDHDEEKTSTSGQRWAYDATELKHSYTYEHIPEYDNGGYNDKIVEDVYYDSLPTILNPRDSVDLSYRAELKEYVSYQYTDISNQGTEMSRSELGEFTVALERDDRIIPSGGKITEKSPAKIRLKYSDSSVGEIIEYRNDYIYRLTNTPQTATGEYILTVPSGEPGDRLTVSAHSFFGRARTSWVYEWSEWSEETSEEGHWVYRDKSWDENINVTSPDSTGTTKKYYNDGWHQQVKVEIFETGEEYPDRYYTIDTSPVRFPPSQLYDLKPGTEVELSAASEYLKLGDKLVGFATWDDVPDGYEVIMPIDQIGGHFRVKLGSGDGQSDSEIEVREVSHKDFVCTPKDEVSYVYTYRPGGLGYTLKGSNYYNPHGSIVSSFVVPSGKTGDTLTLIFDSFYNEMHTYCYYDWVGEAAAVPADSGNDKPITQDVVTVADNNPGEDAGTDIISEIIEGADDPGIAERIGTAGGGALTVGGVTALLKGKKKKKEKEEKKKEKKKSRYRMYVSKDFGDALQKGGKAVAVRARIDEIDDNGTRHPNQLFTQKIEVSGEEIIVESASLRGNWMEAMIRSDAKSENDKGTLIFKFEGSGGTFRNHITFRLVDKPQLIFPEIKDDGTWVSNGKTPIAYLIAGAGGETSLPFMFLDAASEPEEIKFTTPSDIDITEKREENYTIGYYAVIANRTKEAEKENDIFAEMRTETVGLEAVFAGDVVVRGEFYIDIVPAGLSVLIRGGMNPLREGKPGVRDKLKDGFLEVISYATRQDDELTLDPLIRPTGFDLCYAYTDLKGNCHIETEAECFRFGKLMPTDEATNSILAKYEYEIGTTGGFSIEPQDSLPELEEKYYVKLPVSASAEGFFANADIPIRLLGEPYDPLQDWKTEYRELQLAILRYYPIEYAKQRLRYVRNELNDPEIYDKSWLRAMRKSIIEASQDYWLLEVKYQEKLIMYYDISDTIFKKPPRFMADVALKIIFKYYYGENEGWISPLVGMCLDILDEVLWDYIQTGEMNVDLNEKIMKFATDALENYISVSDDAGKLTNFDKSDPKLKQFIIFLTMWLIADLYKNYSGMNPKDFWESVRKTCVDLTGMAGKKYLGAKLQQVINSETMQKFLKQKWVQNITDYLKKNLAPEQAYIKGKGIDYGNNNLKFTRRFDQQMELVNGDKIGKLGDLGDKPSLINFSKDGRRLDINNLDTLDIKNKMNTMLPDAKGNFQFSEMELDHMELLTYAGIIQTYIEEFFGLGIANITDSDKIDPKGQDFLNFDVELKVAEIGLDIAFRIEVNYLKLLTSVATGAFIPSCFEAIYDALIGWYPFKNTGSESLSNDVGREIHKMDKLPSA